MDTMVGSQPAINLSQGQVIASDSPLDVAIDGAGFFQIQQPDGSHLYTRNGQFHINSDNQLVNQSNLPVLGDTGPIQLIPGGGEISIDISGRIFQGTTPVATLKVTEFQNPGNLELHAGGFMIKPGENAGPQDVENPRVLQGYYEASNVNPVTEMVKLIAVSRAYEANQKVIQNQDRMLERATSAFSPQ
jgi:flagellar basal-body rod protein FlgF